MSTKLIDYLVPNVNVSTEVLYEQLEELRELYVASRGESANSPVAAMFEAVVNWTEQVEG